MRRSVTVHSLESSFTSSSDTTSSGFSARGIGSISGRAIYAIGQLALQGVEHVAIFKRIYTIAEMLPNASAMDIKEVERLYKDLFELSRQDLYLDHIRSLALRTIFRQICSRETDYLVRCVNKYKLKHRKTFLKELVTMLDPLRLVTAKEGRLNDVATAYKKSLAGTEVHSLVPFIEFCTKLADSSKRSTVDLLLEFGMLDFLLHAQVMKFQDPLAKDDPDAPHRTSIFKMSCDALLTTISALEPESAVFNHPIFNGETTSRPPLRPSSNRKGQTQDILQEGATAQPTLDTSRSQLLLNFAPFTSSTPSSSTSPSLVPCLLSPESSDVLSPSEPNLPERPLPPLPFNNRTLAPTHLTINEFGSRFLPHAKSPIRCLLALQSDSLLLIGHDNGLSVINMFPRERLEDGSLTINGPDEARARMIWSGLSVLQMSLLEQCNEREDVPGAVLALVGPVGDISSSKDVGLERSIRIYNLSSLLSLAKWAIMQKTDSPLDLGRTPKARQSPSSAKHMSLPRGLKSLLIGHSEEPSETSYDLLLSPSSLASSKPTLTPDSLSTTDSDWDLVDETSQLHWEKDFVPLVMPSSSLTVTEYALWDDERGTGGCLLAVATRNSVLLYERPVARRNFQYIKTIPLSSPPRSITFHSQATRSAHAKASAARSNTEPPTTNPTSLSSISDFAYGDNLALFVIFDKKAYCIRLSDSTIGKVELYSGGGDRRSTVSESSTTSPLRSRLSLDTSYSSRWIPPIQCTIPVVKKSSTKDISILTRGKDTHILPCPIPVGSSSRPPIFATTWRSAPTSISARVSVSARDGDQFLQLIALGGEAGLEVQEIPLSCLQNTTKVGSSREMRLWVEEDLGGYTGLLCIGGHWDQSHHRYHRRRLSSLWMSPQNRTDDSETPTKQMKEEGVYGWCRKGLEDWRVFWVGGSLTDVSDEDYSI